MKVSRVEAKIGDVGIAPLVIIVLFIIGASAVAYSVDTITSNIRKTKQYKAAMDAQGQNIDRLLQAGRDLKDGKINQDTYNAVKDQVKNDNKAIQDQAEDLSKPGESFFAGAQKFLVIGGVLWLASKIIK